MNIKRIGSKLFQKIGPAVVPLVYFLITVGSATGELPPYQQYKGTIQPGIVITRKTFSNMKRNLKSCFPRPNSDGTLSMA